MKVALSKISDPFISSSGISLFVLRLDKIHPHISGNKWYKLKYNLEEAKKKQKGTLLTFGGAYSNHIAAVAAAGKEYGFRTIGIIRGDELAPYRLTPDPSPKERGEQPLNDTLRFAKECGMQLHFISREEFRRIREDEIVPEEILSQLHTPSSELYLLPEGGTNALAVKGCAEILSHVDIPFDYVCCPVGTGGTVAGIISSSKGNQRAIGFSVLRSPGYHMEEILKWSFHFQINSSSNFQINEDYHFGGYAKHTPELLKFISDFETQNDIPLDQVYTGKMMFGIYDLIKKNHFSKNSTVIAIHTGGLQGKLVAPVLKRD